MDIGSLTKLALSLVQACSAIMLTSSARSFVQPRSDVVVARSHVALALRKGCALA